MKVFRSLVLASVAVLGFFSSVDGPGEARADLGVQQAHVTYHLYYRACPHDPWHYYFSTCCYTQCMQYYNSLLSAGYETYVYYQ